MTMLHDFLDNASSGKVAAGGQIKRLSDLDKSTFTWIVKTASDAICFDIGHTEDFSGLKYNRELAKNPYKITWIEGKVADGIVCMLVFDHEDGIKSDIAIIQKNQGILWQVLAVVRIEIDHDEAPMIDVLHNYMIDSINHHNVISAALGTLYFPFLTALNCTNTTAVEHNAPKHINKKRKAKGKHPIHSYWTLHLPNTTKGDLHGNGTHAPPRVHLRRGHIRQYAPGKYTWVQPCVVGEKKNGMVEKDYRLHA